MQSAITLDQVKGMIRDAVKRYPNRINPRQSSQWGGQSVCLYTGKNGTHCIAGQVLADLGASLPEYDSINNSEAFGIDTLPDSIPMEQDALDYVRAAQYVFDGGPIARFPKTEQRRWSSALSLLEKYTDEALVLSA